MNMKAERGMQKPEEGSLHKNYLLPDSAFRIPPSHRGVFFL